MADGDNLGFSPAVAFVAFDMADEIADMVADFLVLIVDWKGAQDPVEVGFPISLVAAHGSAKGDYSFRTPYALARPDLNAQAVRNTLARTSGLDSAFVGSTATPHVAPLIEPAGRALVVDARCAILGIIGDACSSAERGPAASIHLRIVRLLRKQGIGQDACGDRPSLLPLSVVVLAFGALDDLVRLLIEVEACATRKQRERDRHGDRFIVRAHAITSMQPPGRREIRSLKGCSALKRPPSRRQRAAALPRSGSIHTNQGKAPPQRNRRLREGQRA